MKVIKRFYARTEYFSSLDLTEDLVQEINRDLDRWFADKHPTVTLDLLERIMTNHTTSEEDNVFVSFVGSNGDAYDANFVEYIYDYIIDTVNDQPWEEDDCDVYDSDIDIY